MYASHSNLASSAKSEQEHTGRLLQLCALGCGIGVGSAGLAFALCALIALFTNLFFFGRVSLVSISPVSHQLGLLVLVIPPLGGLLLSLLTRVGSRAQKLSAATPTVDSFVVARNRIAPEQEALQPVASALSIGSGGPFGPEGPVAQGGGLLANWLGRWFHLSPAERKTLLAAGAAAGLAALFGTPLAAIFLVAEVLLFEVRARSLLPVVMACVTAGALRWFFWSESPLLSVQSSQAIHWTSLGTFALLGILAGLAAVALTKAVATVEQGFDALALPWMWWPVLGGLVVGLVGLVFPQALGIGSDYLQPMLTGRATLGFLLALFIFKSIAWVFASGSGISGGVLVPLALIGGALGGVLAQGADWIFPGGADATLWVEVCIAGMLAGALRAPMAAAVLVLEVTHDSAAWLPLLIAAGVSNLVAVMFVKHPLLARATTRHDAHLNYDAGTDELLSQPVSDLMTTDVATIPEQLSLRQLVQHFQPHDGKKPHHAYPVVDECGRLMGMVTRADLPELEQHDSQDWLRVGDLIGFRPVVTARPDESLRTAAERMVKARVNQLPVVAPEAGDRLLGLISRIDLLRALAISSEIDQENKSPSRQAA